MLAISRFMRSSKTSIVRQLSTSEVLEKTALYDLHHELGGKMVSFAGYSLPVQYEGLGVLKEHLHTRAPHNASLFDVSHMGQIKWHGKDAVKFIEKMVVGDIASLKEGEAKLSLIMNEKGG
jgi:aminomethyltransferase